MDKENMPAAEANLYELAFHVLPTVAEGEVETVFQKLKDIVTSHGGEITLEEAPARFDLAYDIIKYLEGRNRKFTSAYFGWVRFSAEPTAIEVIGQEVESMKELLRHLLVKLTKVEEENPFFFHEALAEQKVETVEVNEETAVVKKEDTEAAEKKDEGEEKPKKDGVETTDKV